MADLRRVRLEEFLRDLDMQPGAVAGLAVGVDRAAMPDRFQGADRRLDDGAARRAVDRGDEADAAGVMLLGGIVEAVGCETLCFGAIGGGEVGHWRPSSR